MNMRLEGKTCLITGAAGGIGMAMARAFLQEGACVVMTDQQAGELERLAGGLDSPKHQLRFHQMDVTDPAAIAAVVAAEPDVNVLVNNAAAITIGNLLQTKHEDLQKVMRVNVEGLLLVTQAVLPQMLARGGGAVLNMASLAGVHAMSERFAYGASKAAIVMMTRSIAIDFVKQGIRANCICPARVHTGFVEGYVRDHYGDQFDERMRLLAEYQPVGRMIRTEEVAEMAVYLVSDAAAMVTGQAFVIDGGVTAGDH